MPKARYRIAESRGRLAAATQDLRKGQIVGPDKRQPFAKTLELLLELSTPELSQLSGSHHHEHLLGLGKQLQDVIDESRKIVRDRDGGLVLAKRRVAKKSLIDRREQERCVGKEFLSMLAREDRRRAGDSHDELRLGTIGERGSDVVDDRLFGRADKSCRADDDLNDVHGSLGALVQVYAEVAGEVVHRQAAAVERLQHQDLPVLAERSHLLPPRASADQSTPRVGIVELRRCETRSSEWDRPRFCSVQGYMVPVEA